jgi:flagellum-specific ATP synthase
MRGILDGHLWLARNIANRGHYPAIDILESISRIMVDIVDENHLKAAREITRLVAVYRDIEDLVNIGAYAPGTNAEYDLAVQSQKAINEFLQQGICEKVSFNDAVQQLARLVQNIKRTTGGKSREQKGEPEKAKPQQPTLGLERMAVGL